MTCSPCDGILTESENDLACSPYAGILKTPPEMPDGIFETSPGSGNILD